MRTIIICGSQRHLITLGSTVGELSSSSSLFRRHLIRRSLRAVVAVRTLYFLMALDMAGSCRECHLLLLFLFHFYFQGRGPFLTPFIFVPSSSLPPPPLAPLNHWQRKLGLLNQGRSLLFAKRRMSCSSSSSSSSSRQMSGLCLLPSQS